jgi:putative nucleotidyltransferase with HDIG domain
MSTTSAPPMLGPLTADEIRRKIDAVPRLASLQSVNLALAELVNSEQSVSGQIAGIIRRDPSLTARLLRMVNSVYFGLSTKVNNIEEAVFYLGVRQIRELSTATPIIEELITLRRPGLQLPWKELWQHSVSTAIMTREVLAITDFIIDDETDYISGLLHDIGKVVMAYVFPEQFQQIAATPFASTREVCQMERELIGWDHAAIGSHYLQRHQLSEEITSAILHHHEPEHATQHKLLAAGVQVADQLVRHAGMRGGFEQIPAPASEAWLSLPGWRILFGDGERESRIADASIRGSMQRLPGLVASLL